MRIRAIVYLVTGKDKMLFLTFVKFTISSDLLSSTHFEMLALEFNRLMLEQNVGDKKPPVKTKR